MSLSANRPRNLEFIVLLGQSVRRKSRPGDNIVHLSFKKSSGTRVAEFQLDFQEPFSKSWVSCMLPWESLSSNSATRWAKT